MKAKKVNDLAQELMDDLLEETSTPHHEEQGQSLERTEAVADKTAEGKASSKSETLEIEKLKTKSQTKSTLELQTKTQSRVRGANLTAASVTEMKLQQSENLKLAQDKIIDLEEEIERLREQNEALAAAGETFKNRTDELLAQVETLENKLTDSKSQLEEEKEILLNSLQGKDKEVNEYKMKVEELEMRLSTNIKKIRNRERELENRLEIAKLENSALTRNKDEIILELKRQIDQLTMELDNYRVKGQELNKKLDSKQEVLRRTVKALRIALAMLEGSENIQMKKKKVG